jgi:hypothetical protein
MDRPTAQHSQRYEPKTLLDMLLACLSPTGLAPEHQRCICLHHNDSTGDVLWRNIAVRRQCFHVKKLGCSPGFARLKHGCCSVVPILMASMCIRAHACRCAASRIRWQMLGAPRAPDQLRSHLQAPTRSHFHRLCLKILRVERAALSAPCTIWAAPALCSNVVVRPPPSTKSRTPLG